jgi:putative addiction module component (TIGR02574 family)
MSDRISVSDVLSLPLEDRLRLVEEIWDSIAACPDAVLLTEAQRQELDSRLEAHRRNPTEGSPWAEVKKRLMQNR